MKKRKEEILRLFSRTRYQSLILYKSILIKKNSNSTTMWYKDGQFHNENGPAIIFNNKNKEWYLKDIEYTEEEWKLELEKRKNIRKF